MDPASMLMAGNDQINQTKESFDQMMTNMINVQMANKAQRFAERMSNTAHQREVKDLIAAGLNPMLSAMGGNGASSPVGVVAQIDSPLKGLTSNALAISKQALERKNIEADTALKTTSSQLNSAAQAREVQQAGYLANQSNLVAQQLETEKHTTNTARAQADMNASEATKRRMGLKPYKTEVGQKVLPWIDYTTDKVSQLFHGSYQIAPRKVDNPVIPGNPDQFKYNKKNKQYERR